MTKMEFPNENILEKSIKKYNMNNPIKGLFISIKIKLTLWWINLKK